MSGTSNLCRDAAAGLCPGEGAHEFRLLGLYDRISPGRGHQHADVSVRLAKAPDFRGAVLCVADGGCRRVGAGGRTGERGVRRGVEDDVLADLLPGHRHDHAAMVAFLPGLQPAPPAAAVPLDAADLGRPGAGHRPGLHQRVAWPGLAERHPGLGRPRGPPPVRPRPGRPGRGRVLLRVDARGLDLPAGLHRAFLQALLATGGDHDAGRGGTVDS